MVIVTMIIIMFIMISCQGEPLVYHYLSDTGLLQKW